jgi:TetR/AcrR family transcriptional repressor of nem operon
MRYPAKHKEHTRERIVRSAARRFRSRGTEGATIGNLMRDLRLTHGGFYRHFRSKEQLFLGAFEQSLKELAASVHSVIQHAPRGGELKALIDGYLSTEHVDDVAGGCPVAVLATEIARRPPKARAEFLRVLINHIESVAILSPMAAF